MSLKRHAQVRAKKCSEHSVLLSWRTYGLLDMCVTRRAARPGVTSQHSAAIVKGVSLLRPLGVDAAVLPGDRGEFIYCDYSVQTANINLMVV